MSASLRLNIFIIFLLIVFVFLQYRLWLQPGGLLDMMHLKKSLALQQMQTDNIKKHNEALLFQVERLQNSKDGTEARARNELGMVKKGETFYQVVK